MEKYRRNKAELGDAASASAAEGRQDWLKQLEAEYARKAIRTAAAVRLVQLLLLAGMLGLWEAAGGNGWIDPLLFSYPSRIFSYLWTAAADGTLWPHLLTTVIETVSGFVLGTLLGAGLAALLWWIPFLSRVFDPYMVVMNSMPKVALGPILIVGLGPGYLSIIATALSVTVIITTLVIYNRFREIDGNYVKVIRLFGGTRGQVFRFAILPASFPAIVSALKVNVGLAWIGVIVGEFLTAKQGLGYLIIYGFQVFNFTLVLSSLMVIAVVAAGMYRLVSALESLLTSGWRER
ncbi:ABC transporter permease [Paenibacillus darwinianus]|uniref:ABC transporter permease n=1 Tax=Paenibacillus darwinianus TaxID=1380763 RepID=A0A9W5S370_9BACL|nr:ABC transporter permease [Paenibacillus darwinianus]EXX89777.1 ABC transporter permease [Paenibacillus darwinianus]EXX90141.1 ABC transporter permease [Paenibacillus darwinianus]EXX90507.1 ABC transporter permease [Paenibacillus darwinianus]